jgi:hypothetical protein
MPILPETAPKYTTHTVPARAQRRSERVMLQIPLQLSARLPGGSRIRIEAKTLVVNAHGGLLDVGMEMAPGQRIMLSHNRCPEPVTATILRIEKSDGERFSAAFEFEFPVTSFWPITFPPDNDLSWLD